MEKPVDRVALFLPSLAGGGMERVFLSLAEGFSSAGYNVDLVLVGTFGQLMSQIDRRVSIVDLKKRRMITALPGLVKYLKVSKPLILLAGLPHANILAVWAAWLARTSTRVVISEHAPPLSLIKEFPSTKDWLTTRLAKIFYPKASAIVAVSRSVAAELTRLLGKRKNKIFVIGNPIVLSRVEKLAQELVDHRWLDTHDCPVILSAGRLHPHKDFSTLLQALAIINKTRLMKLIILGEGDERTHLEALIAQLNLENLVDMPGFMENPYRFFSRADVFVLPSVMESFSVVILEALACGTQVVSTDCGGPAEILDGGKYGGLAPVGNAQALAEKVLYQLDNPLSPVMLRERAMDYDLLKITERYQDIFEQVLAKERNG